MSTAAVARVGPSSMPSSGTRWTITPVDARSPASASSQARSDRVGAGQVAGERRMQVDHLVGEPAEEAHREDAHPTGEHDEVGLEPGDDVGEPGVVLGPRLAGMPPDVDGRHTRGVGALEREHVGPVRDHGHDVGRRCGRRRRHRGPLAGSNRCPETITTMRVARAAHRRERRTGPWIEPSDAVRTTVSSVNEKSVQTDDTGPRDELADDPGRLGDRALERVRRRRARR